MLLLVGLLLLLFMLTLVRLGDSTTVDEPETATFENISDNLFWRFPPCKNTKYDKDMTGNIQLDNLENTCYDYVHTFAAALLTRSSKVAVLKDSFKFFLFSDSAAFRPSDGSFNIFFRLSTVSAISAWLGLG